MYHKEMSNIDSLLQAGSGLLFEIEVPTAEQKEKHNIDQADTDTLYNRLGHRISTLVNAAKSIQRDEYYLIQNVRDDDYELVTDDEYVREIDVMIQSTKFLLDEKPEVPEEALRKILEAHHKQCFYWFQVLKRQLKEKPLDD